MHAQLAQKGVNFKMRILTIIALAAMTFGIVSCARHEPPPPPPSDGKMIPSHEHHHARTHRL
jgi:hypothetical protein